MSIFADIAGVFKSTFRIRRSVLTDKITGERFGPGERGLELTNDDASRATFSAAVLACDEGRGLFQQRNVITSSSDEVNATVYSNFQMVFYGAVYILDEGAISVQGSGEIYIG